MGSSKRELEIEEWGPPYDEIALGLIAGLFVQEFGKPPWSEQYEESEVVAGYRENLEGEEKFLQNIIVVAKEHGIGTQAVAFTVGVIVTIAEKAKLTEMLVKAPYMGGVLGELVARHELNKFWSEIGFGEELERFLFFYDTVRDTESMTSVIPWLQATIQVCEWGICEGVNSFVGVTDEDTMVRKLLGNKGLITHERVSGGAKDGGIRPTMIYSSNLSEMKEVFTGVVNRRITRSGSD